MRALYTLIKSSAPDYIGTTKEDIYEYSYDEHGNMLSKHTLSGYYGYQQYEFFEYIDLNEKTADK